MQHAYIITTIDQKSKRVPKRFLYQSEIVLELEMPENFRVIKDRTHSLIGKILNMEQVHDLIRKLAAQYLKVINIRMDYFQVLENGVAGDWKPLSELDDISHPPKKKPYPGTFISFEGGEGAGKSTQVVRLAKRLQQEGHEVVVSHEPGGTGIGKSIRELVKYHPEAGKMAKVCEAMLMTAARAQAVEELILPALKRGAVVISDRYLDSSVAYQGYARQNDLCMIHELNDIGCQGVVPDLTIFMNIDPEVAFKRISARKPESDLPDRFENEALEFHQRVRRGFLVQADQYPERIAVVDADRDSEVISQEIWQMVSAEVQSLNIPMTPSISND